MSAPARTEMAVKRAVAKAMVATVVLVDIEFRVASWSIMAKSSLHPKKIKLDCRCDVGSDHADEMHR